MKQPVKTSSFSFLFVVFLFCVSSGESSAQTCSPAPVGLASWYSGDGNALDSRSRNNGTLQNGAGFAAGQVGQSFNLSGGSHISAASSSVTINSSLTVEAWVNPISLVNNPVIFEKGVTLSNRFGFQIVADGSIGAYIDGGSFAVQSPVNTVPTNTFTHVAFVFDDTANQSRLFVNGVLVASNNFPASISSNNGAVTIGESLTTGFTDFFDGRIDEVSLYNRALSTSEIAAIANAGTAGKCKPTATTSPSGHVAWWAGDGNADDSAGTTNGILQGGAGFAVGKVGQGFNFDGADDLVTIGDPANLKFTNTDFAVEGWFTIPNIPDNPGTQCGARYPIFGYDNGYSIEIVSDGRLRLRKTTTAGGGSNVASVNPISPNVYHHYAAIHTPTQMRLYVDGILDNTVTITDGTILYVADDFPEIGHFTCGFGPGAVIDFFFKGQIDETSIYNRALTDAEITSIFNAGIAGKLKEGPTATGTNVSTNVGSDATINFSNVSTAGTTQQIPLDPSLFTLPGGFTTTGLIYDIDTTAAFTGPANVCFHLPAFNDANAFSFLKVLHHNGTSFTDVTTGHNFAARLLCGQATSLSPFAIAQGATPTAADATISGRILANVGTPIAGAIVNLTGTQTRKTITDANGNYRFDNVETSGFYTVTPTRANYSFGPASQSFSQLGNATEAAFTGTPNAVIVGNSIDGAEYFVRQHYLDFLGREPDESGFNFWSDQILSCGSDAACRERRTINVSAAYFLSIEFQKTGGLVDSLYRASYGRAPRYAEFVPDTETIARGVIVGRDGWQRQLATNKAAFIDAFVNRAAFHAAYDGLSSSDFVDALISHTGVSFSQAERAALVSSLNNQTATRAEVLREVAENEQFMNAKRNEAFVMMEYFGYLRRDPDESGYQFWLNKLNQFDGNFEQAEMVKAFINSGEYRARFPR